MSTSYATEDYLNEAYITPALNDIFTLRRDVDSRRRGADAIATWDDMAVDALRSETTDSSKELEQHQRWIESIGKAVDGQEIGSLLTQDELLLRVRVLWLVFDRKKRQAREIAIAALVPKVPLVKGETIESGGSVTTVKKRPHNRMRDTVPHASQPERKKPKCVVSKSISWIGGATDEMESRTSRGESGSIPVALVPKRNSQSAKTLLKKRPGNPSHSTRHSHPDRLTGHVPPGSQEPPPSISSTLFTSVLRIILNTPRPPTYCPPRKQSKPEARPPVWAESRQELCEALPYYRAFQAGLYMHRKIAHGYLLDGFPAPRDLWADDGRIIISHGGGQSTRVPDPKKKGKSEIVLQADQSSRDARIDALLRAARHKTPLVLLAGQGYEKLPWDLDVAYIVLGWYWISAIWVEAEPLAKGVAGNGRGYFRRYKVRFDWVDGQGAPWWLRKDALPSPSPSVGEEIFNSMEVSSCRVIIPPSPGGSPSRFIWEKAESMIQQVHLPTPPPTPPKPSESAQLSEGIRTEVILGDLGVPSCLLPGESPEQTVTFASIREPCPSCRQSSIRIYQEGWTCLHPLCPQFWMFNTPIGLLPIPPGICLTYSPDFLIHQSQPSIIPPCDISPPPPTDGLVSSHEISGRALWRGWVCGRCGRANCRFRWEVWECINCGNRLAPLTIQDVVKTSHLDPPAFLGEGNIDQSSGIKTYVKRVDATLPGKGMTVVIYDLPKAVYHILPDERGRADRLFEEYQLAAITTTDPLFQRSPLRCSTVKGRLLAQHFAVNSGARYKYSVDSQSIPFEDSPRCITQALDLITKTVNLVIPPSPDRVIFNEVLSVFYREGEKMSWHDDGEKGLGPVVASLSLGSRATMSWRIKQTKPKLNTNFYVGSGTGTSEKAEKEENGVVALSIVLSHGDVMIMEGRELQVKYNHRVIPEGLRVAATARLIGLEDAKYSVSSCDGVIASQGSHGSMDVESTG